jgi:dihydrofolate reductase
MVRTLYFTATSADGFIADQNNSLEWLFEVPRDNDQDWWDEFIAGVSVMAMGATTYEWVLDHDNLLDDPGKWREFYGDRPCWVFSHRELPTIPGADVRFVAGDAATVHAQMSQAANGRNIWLVGGGDLVGQFDDVGLLDEIHLGLQPVFLGDGAPLLPRRLTSERVQLRVVRQVGQTIQIVYDVQPRSGS